MFTPYCKNIFDLHFLFALNVYCYNMFFILIFVKKWGFSLISCIFGWFVDVWAHINEVYQCPYIVIFFFLDSYGHSYGLSQFLSLLREWGIVRIIQNYNSWYSFFPFTIFPISTSLWLINWSYMKYYIRKHMHVSNNYNLIIV